MGSGSSPATSRGRHSQSTTAPAAPGADGPQDSNLKAHMKGRHLVMMSLGSAIGAGLFVGSGAGIAAAGPSAVSYTHLRAHET